jgi:hypothetical protein
MILPLVELAPEASPVEMSASPLLVVADPVARLIEPDAASPLLAVNRDKPPEAAPLVPEAPEIRTTSPPV